MEKFAPLIALPQNPTERHKVANGKKMLNPIHQYIIDQFCKIQLERLQYIENNQRRLRAERGYSYLTTHREDHDLNDTMKTSYYFFEIVVHPNNNGDENYVVLPENKDITFYDIRQAIKEQGVEIPFDLWRFHVKPGSVCFKQEKKYSFNFFGVKRKRKR